MKRLVDAIITEFKLKKNYVHTVFVPINFSDAKILKNNTARLNTFLRQGYRYGREFERENGLVIEVWKWRPK